MRRRRGIARREKSISLKNRNLAEALAVYGFICFPESVDLRRNHVSETTKPGDDADSANGGSIRQEGDNLVITIPNPKNLSPDEVKAMVGHDCSTRCPGLISHAASFVF